jgi:hypothetical protein
MRLHIRHIWAFIFIGILFTSCASAQEPLTARNKVSVDTLMLGNVLLWNTPEIYINIVGRITKGSDVHVFTHPLTTGTKALVVRKHTVFAFVNILRNGDCYIAQPEMRVRGEYLTWDLVYYTDENCVGYKNTSNAIKAYVDWGMESNQSRPLEYVPR